MGHRGTLLTPPSLSPVSPISCLLSHLWHTHSLTQSYSVHSWNKLEDSAIPFRTNFIWIKICTARPFVQWVLLTSVVTGLWPTSGPLVTSPWITTVGRGSQAGYHSCGNSPAPSQIAQRGDLIFLQKHDLFFSQFVYSFPSVKFSVILLGEHPSAWIFLDLTKNRIMWTCSLRGLIISAFYVFAFEACGLETLICAP